MDPNLNKNNTGFSSGEMFVAVNLLSKIGAVFVIASVIAFSAASGGYIPDALRMVLVVLVGVIMFIAGEIFYRKRSRVFANALIYGGIAELFISTLIGAYGIRVFQSTGALVMGIITAVCGFLLAIRYKSQGLVIITQVGAMLPVFTVSDRSGIFAVTIYLMIVNCFSAIISRRKFYNGAMFTGIALSWIQMIFVWLTALLRLGKSGGLTAAVFALCCGICQSCGALLNACEKDGETEETDTAAFLISQGTALFFTSLILGSSVNVRAAGAAMLSLALIYTIIAICFGLRYHPRCKAASMLINMALAAAELSVFLLIHELTPLYIVLHATAAAVFCAGVFLKRALFRNWGFALLGIAEFTFFTAMARTNALGLTGEKLLIIAVNLVLWLGIMIALAKKEEKTGGAFRGYTLAVFANTGILISNLISADLMMALDESIHFGSRYRVFAFSALLCAVVWIIAGFAVGRLKYMDNWRAPCSSILYGIGLICLLCGNTTLSGVEFIYTTAGGLCVLAAIIANIISVLAVLDAVIRISEAAPKFRQAAGLVVSGYALLSLTALLGINGFVSFTSCIISIIYITMAAAWIIIGFKKRNALLRRFGLALALFSSAKLFLFDFRSVNAMGRTLLFIGFGITLLAISFAYAAAEKHISGKK